ncbi:MAG: DUF1016 family protein [Actinobacteria bacterium]|nr:MAG: DUF1016 family protein [Actinomycetota bacterium]
MSAVYRGAGGWKGTCDGRCCGPHDELLLSDVSGLIESAHVRAAAAVNSELVLLYWSIGKRVREELLGGQRAE